MLVDPRPRVGKPYRLKANESKSFQGSIVLGMGFVMTPEEAQALIDKDPRNRDVLFPYLNGEDLNSRPDQSPSRWVINFRDWPLERSAEGFVGTADDDQRAEWRRSGRVPEDYPEPVAADYPDCLEIVELTSDQNGKAVSRTVHNQRSPLPQRWWQYADKRPELYATIAGPRDGCWSMPETTKYSHHSRVWYQAVVFYGTNSWFSRAPRCISARC